MTIEQAPDCDRVRCSWTQNRDLNRDQGFSLDGPGIQEGAIA